MRSITLYLLLALLSCCGCVSVPKSNDGSARIDDVIRLSTFDFNLDAYQSWAKRERILRTPVWGLETQPPPLMPREAERLANQKLREAFAKIAPPMGRQSIELIDAGDGLHWVYIVSFTSEAGHAHAQANVIVLMDGTVIEPKLITKDGKDTP